MTRIPLIVPIELIDRVNGDNITQVSSATRRIWTDWNYYTADEKEEIRSLGDRIFGLLKKDMESRNAWHYLLALGCIDYLPAQELIFDLLLNSTDENIRGFAADTFSKYSLENVDDKIIDTLWTLIERDSSLVVRINSLRTVSSPYFASKNGEMARRVFALLESQKHSAIRTAILQILGDIGSIVIVPDLVHIMIARRLEMDKKGSAKALDKIAELNGYNDRRDLIKKITGNDIEES